MELAIDTSSNVISIALSHKGEILSLFSWQTRQNHTIELLPNLICLLQRADVELDSVEAIVVAKGPGSFNGLRVGISTAKGLAFALNVPLLGVSTLEAEAYPFAFTGLPLRAIHNAGRQEIATALYRQRDNEWQRLEAENLATIDALLRRTRQKTLFCGEIPADIAGQIQQNLGRRAIISRNSSLCRLNSVAALGWRKLSEGEHDNLVTLQPLYLRPPHITKPKQRVPFSSSRVERPKQSNGNPQTRC
ncbi:MAG TPA: tRNA (adenosine(37)-N6)-threonylcarbamoyltransferase complex dimerization subunit type 1 TsaB [Dehalococcoidia bacterium]|nr:tRNA (adenosine(37)-N6)-threonylcarbamoyltransferase complex dimerization subunit type 1 TsaB [Dehalococcoidia bacterium]